MTDKTIQCKTCKQFFAMESFFYLSKKHKTFKRYSYCKTCRKLNYKKMELLSSREKAIRTLLIMYLK